MIDLKKLDMDEIRHLGKLSMLPLSQEEEKRAFEEVNSILVFFRAVTEFKGKEPSAGHLATGGRKDGSTAAESTVSDGIVLSFPRKENEMLIVPRSE